MSADSLGGQEALGRLDRTIDELETQLHDSTERMRQAQTLGEVLADVVGSAQSEDGHVHVEYAGSGLRRLDLQPRAMRMASTDLAATITQVLADAVTDYQKRTLEAMTAAGLIVSPEEQKRRFEQAVDTLDTAQRDFAASLRGAAQIIGRSAQVPKPSA